MLRIGVFFLLLSSILMASESFNFHEKRYSYALDRSIEREGTVIFDSEFVTIKYDKPNMTILTFFEDSVSIQHEEKEEVIKEATNPLIYYMFVMLMAIFTDDMQTIQHYFDVSNQNNMTKLLPKEMARRYIKSVSFQKEVRLKILQIVLTNGDRLTIEPIH